MNYNNQHRSPHHGKPSQFHRSSQMRQRFLQQPPVYQNQFQPHFNFHSLPRQQQQQRPFTQRLPLFQGLSQPQKQRLPSSFQDPYSQQKHYQHQKQQYPNQQLRQAQQQQRPQQIHQQLGPPLFLHRPPLPPIFQNLPPPPNAFFPPTSPPSFGICPPQAFENMRRDFVRDEKEEHREAMNEVVDKWLNMNKNLLNNTPETEEKKLLKIHAYKTLMGELVKKVAELKQLNDSLAENMECSGWDAIMKNVKRLKDEVLELQTKLTDEKQVVYVEQLIKQRRQKRLRIRTRKKQYKAGRSVRMSERMKLHEKIDEWQHQEHSKIHMEKMIESLKNEAGESLTEVKRKQTEANELIKVFKLLNELREIRKDNAIYKGIFITPQQEEYFNNIVEESLTLVTSQKSQYEAEEKALRVMREEEAHGFEREEGEKRRKRKRRHEDDLLEVDPLLMFRSFWLQSEDSLPALVHVRTLWDSFVCLRDVPGATKIPNKWPEPVRPTSKDWEYFVVKSKAKI